MPLRQRQNKAGIISLETAVQPVLTGQSVANRFCKMIRAWVKPLTFVALLLAASLAAAAVAVPPLKSRITDLTGTLSLNQAAQLEQKLAAFEAKKGSQVAVLIVPTTQPETIEQYSIRVAGAWKLGRKGVDDGALLLLAKNDRTLRIETGYGLEGALPDAVAKRIIEEIIVPKLRQGDFAGGIAAGVERILAVIEGELLPPPQSVHGATPAGASDIVLENIIPVFIMLLVAGKLLQAMFGRFIGAAVMSTAAGLIGWLVFSSLLVAIFIVILTFFVSLFGNTGGGIYRGGRGGWSGGGFGGSGGGFGGGGGGFGGGGASGRW